MTTTDSNDLVPAQEKLEWVTPKISLMEAGDTMQKTLQFIPEIRRSLLTDYISNPSTPTKTNNTNGSLKTLF